MQLGLNAAKIAVDGLSADHCKMQHLLCGERVDNRVASGRDAPRATATESSQLGSVPFCAYNRRRVRGKFSFLDPFLFAGWYWPMLTLSGPS
jgi:hypothetical protein